MKLNISNPSTGGQKMIEVEDETKLRAFYDKRISHEVEGDVLGDDFKGYIFRIGGGNDKEGFPMLQGVLTAARVQLLFTKGMPCYRPRKRGERKRKSVRGCIVSSNLAVLSLIIVKKGDKDIPGLTDDVKPRRLGPKRASKIRKLFNLEKKDDVRQYVVRRQIVKEGKKPTTKAPKIQRLITPQRLQRKRERKHVKKQRYEKSKKDAEEYNTLISKRVKEQREKRKAVVAKKRSLSRLQSGKEEGGDQQGKKKEGKKEGKKEEKKEAKKPQQPKAAKETVQKPAAAKQTTVPAAQLPKPTSTGAPPPQPKAVPAKPQPQAQGQAPAKQAGAAPAKEGDGKKKKKKK